MSAGGVAGGVINSITGALTSSDSAPKSDRPLKFSLFGPPEHKTGRQLPPLSEDSYNTIKADLEELLSTSRDFWPNHADFGTYRGLMIRVAWHCSGTYRHSDGRGGCDGARNRFAPENLWEDNTNIDKGLQLLQPLYDKYEDVISWYANLSYPARLTVMRSVHHLTFDRRRACTAPFTFLHPVDHSAPATRPVVRRTWSCLR